jgi:hypothetical protein
MKLKLQLNSKTLVIKEILSGQETASKVREEILVQPKVDIPDL